MKNQQSEEEDEEELEMVSRPELAEQPTTTGLSNNRVRFSLQTASNPDMIELTEPFLAKPSPVQKRTNKLIAIWSESNLDKAIMRSEAVAFISNKPHAWKPMLTPKFVVNLFLVCSILFIPIGIILYFTSMNIYEFKFDYTDCVDTRNEEMTCHEQLMKDITYRCQCRIGFYEDSFQDETLNVYYMLENYFQNIRRYAKSIDPYQLLGRRSSDDSDDLAVECEPYRYYIDPVSKLKRKYAPCGAIANSFFNDTFTMHYLVKKTNETIKLNISKHDIAWDTDRRFKFMNPTDLNFGRTSIRPPNWSKNITELNSCYQNEDLMVWMRTAAFPSFRKLYGRVLLSENQLLAYKISDKSNKTNSLRDLLYRFLNKSDLLTPTSGSNSTAAATLAALATSSTSPTVKLRFPKGAYFVDIDYNYPVKQFNGRKFFILANTSWLGGKCYFMAWAYIVVGVLCFFTSIILFFLHLYYGNMHYNTAVLLKDKNSGDVLEDSPPFR